MKKLSFAIGSVLFTFFVVAGLFFTVLHSSWGREKILLSLTRALEESGWKVHTEQSKGTPLEEMQLYGITLESPEGDVITIGSLKTRLSTIRLLKREIAFQEFLADEIFWTRSSAAPKSEPLQTEQKGIPFALVFPNIKLTRVSLPQSDSLASLQGSLRISRYNRKIRLQIQAERDDAPGAIASLFFSARPSRDMNLQIDVSTPSLMATLSPWLHLPADGSADLHLYAKGKWSDLSSHLFGGNPEGSIKGVLQGSLAIVDTTVFPEPLLERDWKIFTSLELNQQRELHVSKLSFRSDPGIHLKGNLVLARDFSLKKSHLQLTAENLKNTGLVPLDGFFLAHLQSNEEIATLTFSSSNLSRESLSIQSVLGRLSMKREEEIWKGAFDLNAKIKGEPITLLSHLFWYPKESLQIREISLTSSLANLSGALTLYPDHTMEGELQAAAGNLHEFNTFNPTWPLYGKGELALRWKIENGKQLLEADAKGSDLFYDGLQVQSAFFYADLSSSTTSVFYAELLDASYQSLFAETISIDAESLDGATWPIRLFAEGDWKGAFSFAADGALFYEKPNTTFDLQNLNGILFSQPLALASPLQIEISPDLFRLKELDLSIGEASLLAEIEHKKDTTKASLLLDRVPLDFLSLNPLEISVAGLINLNAQILEEKGKTSGSLSAEIVDVEIGAFGEQDPVEGVTVIDAKLSNERLTVSASMDVRGEKILNLSADLPYRFSLYPFLSEPLLEKKAKGAFAFSGRIEEILDFFNIGAHRLEGTCMCDLSLRGTLAHPLLEGYCNIDDGYYENYYTGTELRNLQAEILAERHSLYLRSLTAEDSQNKGRLSLTGEAKLSIKERFPFRFDGEFTRLDVTDLAWMKMEAGGVVQISGNADSARISGQAIILEGDLSIPERIPPSLPNLQVKYINTPKPIALEETSLENQSRYPIFFNYRVFAPEGISISGKGLSSEWKGDFHVGGTYTDIEARGQLDMLNGSFSFSGRVFKLIEGSLTFSGRPQEMPILNIAAQLNLQNLAIIARLKGFLNTPQLSFHSIPPLPMGSILSYLLFGQDLSQISAIQAAQLVNSLSTLSGQQSDSSSRRSLNVDRLRILATPVGDEGAESYALQVGKYVTRGVLVSVSQGLESGSTNLSVEIDLANGFVFEAASLQQQEQGKFSIKWNYNY